MNKTLTNYDLQAELNSLKTLILFLEQYTRDNRPHRKIIAACKRDLQRIARTDGNLTTQFSRERDARNLAASTFSRNAANR